MLIKNCFGIKTLFVLILALSSGCAVTPQQQPVKKALSDVLVFRDLKEVDLDRDGAKEIVAIYTARSNESGVKVIKFYDDKGKVIFERTFDTADIKFEMKNDVPILIVDKTNQTAGCSTARRMISVYRWDGKAFTPTDKQ